jgi:diguanylate cyclase (GGDEF)-like protein
MNAPVAKDAGIGVVGVTMLDRFLPMHLLLSRDKTIRHAGPTLCKMAGRDPLPGRPADDVIELRRPCGLDRFDKLLATAGERLTLVLRGADDLPLRGVLMAMPDGGALIDVSLGLSFERAVTRFGLTVSDFSPCDQTVNLLYLQEANAVISRLSRQLTDRLTAAREAAELEALTDPLTDLANRRAMDVELHRLLDQPRADFALVHLDLDFFKQVNDTHGHAAGDHVLMEVSKILCGDLRRLDMAGRVGGDEFLIILRDTVSEPAISAMVRRLIRQIERPIPFEGRICRVSASVGVAVTSTYAKRPSADVLMADADAALYRAKNAGRATLAIHGQAMAPARQGARPRDPGWW